MKKQPVCLPNHLSLRRQAASSWYTLCHGPGTSPVHRHGVPRRALSAGKSLPRYPSAEQGRVAGAQAAGKGRGLAPGLDPGPA